MLIPSHVHHSLNPSPLYSFNCFFSSDLPASCFFPSLPLPLSLRLCRSWSLHYPAHSPTFSAACHSFFIYSLAIHHPPLQLPDPSPCLTSLPPIFLSFLTASSLHIPPPYLSFTIFIPSRPFPFFVTIPSHPCFRFTPLLHTVFSPTHPLSLLPIFFSPPLSSTLYPVLPPPHLCRALPPLLLLHYLIQFPLHGITPRDDEAKYNYGFSYGRYFA